MIIRVARRFTMQNTLGSASEALVKLPPFMEFYRPVIEMAERAVESTVNTTGVPWWLAISLLTVGIRASNFPMLFLQYKAMSPLALAMPSYRFLGEILKDSKASNWQKFSTIITSVRQINKSHNTNFTKAFTYVLLQVPQFITFIWSIRSLCARNNELKTGGTAWFVDLTQSDPTMILPLVSLGVTYFNLQRGITPENRDWLINKFKGVIQMWLIISLPITVQWPAGVFCYWVTNAIFTYFQSVLVTNPTIMSKINPNLQSDMMKIYGKSLEQDEAERLANLINTGMEGYIKAKEKDVEKIVGVYLKQQDELEKQYADYEAKVKSQNK
ncbi:hypothetical protein SteCoe_15406 [Stentor coeruleus]|uniref:Membrane insertase YidC/Oxa/ALB C-terminal domain-containing protein n=1 Tax=Stentor coeruleus TaxID=5963 RepID=A0A1R2C3K9_9CILI|nr:hypothetical protein SteCoe_15406 [Stentor coeruleus]